MAITSKNSEFDLRDVVEVPANFDIFNDHEKEVWLKKERMQAILDKNSDKPSKKHLGLYLSSKILASLDENFAKIFNENFSNNILVVDILNNAIFTTEEFQKILKIYDKLMENNNKIVFCEGATYYNIDEVKAANAKINDWADQINSQKLDGKELSPLEKFYLAYDIVTQFEFKESPTSFDARNIISVLNGNKIVCVGFSKILSELCKKIGIECETQLVCEGTTAPNHMTCRVRLKDDKYGVDGVFYSDPTWDSKKKGTKSINNMLLTYQELPVLYGSKLKLADNTNNIAMNYLVVDEKYRAIKTREDWQRTIDEFIKSGKGNFSKFLDDVYGRCSYNSSEEKITPTDDQLKEIIDLYFTGVLSVQKTMDKYAKNNQPIMTSMIALMDIHNMLIGNLLNSYTTKEGFEDLKTRLLGELDKYCPEVASKSFDELRKIYEFDSRNKNNAMFEKMKKNTKHLEFSQFIKLLDNIKKLSPLNKLETEMEMTDLLRTSYAKAYGSWPRGENGLNPFSKLIYCGKNRRSANKVKVADYIEDFYDSLFDISTIFGNLLAGDLEEDEPKTNKNSEAGQNQPGE